jgi:hypothetical protein
MLTHRLRTGCNCPEMRTRPAARRSLPAQRRTLPYIASCLAVAAAVLPLFAQSAAPAPRVDAPQLRLESRFWPNLHQFLYLLAQVESGRAANRPTVRAVVEDARRGSELTDSERMAWQRALEFYQKRIIALSPWEKELGDVNARLAAAGDAPPALPSLPGLSEALAGAAPAYRRAWWSQHDAVNRRWIDEQLTRRTAYGDAVGGRLSRLLRAPWPASEIPVEVVAHATMFGAFQQDVPLMLHLSSTYAGHAGSIGFEQLYHETGHILDDSVFSALRAEAQRQAKPGGIDRWVELTHHILFYTAGDAVRRSIPDHVPYAESQGVWQRAASNRKLLLEHWQPYLDGAISFEEAIRRLVAS